MNVQSAIPVWLQWAWALAGLIIAAGGFVWILGIFWPYLRWSKKMMVMSYELGDKTANHLDKLQGELTPVIDDLKVAVKDVRQIVSDLREKELEKIVTIIDKISKNGGIEDTFEAIRSIPKKLDEAIKSEKKNIMKNL